MKSFHHYFYMLVVFYQFLVFVFQYTFQHFLHYLQLLLHHIYLFHLNPNHMFLFYSFIVLSLLYIVKPLINRVYLWMIRFIPILDKWILIFSQNSIYIFLYQTFSFWIISIVLKYIGFHNDYLVFVIALITVYPMIGLNIKLINRIQAIRKRI